MSFNYNRKGNIVEIIVRDYSGAKIEAHKCNIHDKKKYASILRYLKDKYGFEPEIDIKESVNNSN
jgi:hypothetical protein